MNKKVLAVIALVIIAAVGAYLVWGRSAGTGGYGPVTTIPLGGSSSSLQTLVAAGAPVVCTFATTTPSGSESGTIYIANGMVAGEFTAADQQKNAIKAHMVMLGSVSYAWTSESTEGFKSIVGTTTTSGQGSSVGYNTQMDYACQAWKPDSSKFTLPANISFK